MAEIILLAQEQGIQFGSIQVMDGVYRVANVNTQKEKGREEEEKKPPRVGDARAPAASQIQGGGDKRNKVRG